MARAKLGKLELIAFNWLSAVERRLATFFWRLLGCAIFRGTYNIQGSKIKEPLIGVTSSFSVENHLQEPSLLTSYFEPHSVRLILMELLKKLNRLNRMADVRLMRGNKLGKLQMDCELIQ